MVAAAATAFVVHDKEKVRSCVPHTPHVLCRDLVDLSLQYMLRQIKKLFYKKCHPS